MKNFRIPFSIVFLILFTCFSCDMKNKFVVKGVINNAPNEILYLEKFEIKSGESIDSLVLGQKGQFKFKYNLDDPGFFALRLNDKRLNLIAYPGDQIIINSDADFSQNNTSFDGSDESKHIFYLNQKLSGTKQKLDSISTLYTQKAESEAENSELQKLAGQYDSILNAQRKENIGYIIKNTTKLSSLLALYQQFEADQYILNRVRDVQYYKILSDSLTKYFPESKYVKVLESNTREFINRFNTQKLLSHVEKVGETVLPSIKLPDVNGDSVSLESLKGKMVILNFWASWDQNSVSQSRRLKGIYNKYQKKGLEIYSVSLDNNREKWAAAIRFDEFNWINVTELSYPKSYIANIYNVNTLPTYYLIDKDQSTILGKNLTIEELDRRIGKHLN